MRPTWKMAAGAGAAVFVLLAALRLFRRPDLDWPVTHSPAGPGLVVCFGDSLVAGMGAPSPARSYPRQLAGLLRREVVPVGTPGQTSLQGLRYLEAHPELRGSAVIVTLGGNDILKQVPLDDTLAALRAIFSELQRRGSMVAFTGVQGIGSGRRARAYRELCRDSGVLLIPDVLDDVLHDQDLMSDMIHPSDEGYAIMAERVADALRDGGHL